MCDCTFWRISEINRWAALEINCVLANEVMPWMIVAARTARTSGASRPSCFLPITLSIRYFVEAGKTKLQILPITISAKPIASRRRRGRSISRMSGQSSRNRSDDRFFGELCGITTICLIVWDAPHQALDSVMAHLYSGTSGFAYPSWKPDFYPEKLASKKFLSYYSERLNAVEINYTFRRLPSATTLEKWVSETRSGFVFVLKAHMRITHIQRLKPSEFTDVFFRAIDPLRTARRLGPVLFQLPPALKCDTALLADFLVTLPSDLRCAFEFRHASWLADSVYSMLEKHKVALCLAESEKLVIPKVITSGFVYSRLRMPEYSAEDRKEIADRVQELLESGRDVYVFFKHEETPAGALYAEQPFLAVLDHAGAEP